MIVELLLNLFGVASKKIFPHQYFNSEKKKEARAKYGEKERFVEPP